MIKINKFLDISNFFKILFFNLQMRWTFAYLIAKSYYKITGKGGRILMKRSIKKRLSFIKKIQGVCVQIALFNEYVLKPVILHVHGV